MAQHTPTPWEIGEGTWEPWSGAICIKARHADDENHHIDICWTTAGLNEAANAEFILRAVNAHNELIKTLRKIAEHDYSAADCETQCTEPRVIWEVVAEAALRKAGY